MLACLSPFGLQDGTDIESEWRQSRRSSTKSAAYVVADEPNGKTNQGHRCHIVFN